MKKLILYIFFFFCCLVISSQSEITLSSQQDHGGSVVACQTITLKPGFSFTSASGKSLTLAADPSTCDPFAGKEANLSQDQNYIRTRTFTNAEATRYLDQIQYFDGLGRPMQTVQRGITPKAKDLTSFQEYDNLGRESKSWLPIITGGNGMFIPGTDQDKIKTRGKNEDYKDELPFSHPVYENSPLNRVVEQYGPGMNWRDKKSSVKTGYLTNKSKAALDLRIADSLVCAMITNDSGLNFNYTKNYSAGELYVIRYKDENNNVSYEFKDKLGQVVLTRQINLVKDKDGKQVTVSYDTYFVYDDFGNLKAVFPPLASDLIYGDKSQLSQGSIVRKDLAYLYIYDSRKRCIQKKLPGADWINYVYDKADRLILSQDGEQRNKKTGTKSEWTFIKYDALGRVILSGIYRTDQQHGALQTRFRDVVMKEEMKRVENYGYSWNHMKDEVAVNDVLLINYYDTYDYLLSLNGHTDYKSLLSYQTKSGYGKRYFHGELKENSAKGLLVATRVKHIDSNGKTVNSRLGEVVTTMYYDDKGQLIQSHCTNHIGGVESEYIAYNFTGQPTKKLHIHSDNSGTKTEELYSYAYDHAGRLLLIKHKLSSAAAIVLAENSYDEQGRLKSSTRNNQSQLKTNYNYNIRSWTTNINHSNLLTQKLSYDHLGNITRYEWTVDKEAKRSYDYTYDNLSQLTHAGYNNVASEGRYNTSYSYDKHGNIRTLVRRGPKDAGTAAGSYVVVDNLTLTYNGNQLKNVHDAAVSVAWSESSDFKDYSKDSNQTKVEYSYNLNGSMNKDLNKGISSIEYNSLNLPRVITIANASHQGTIRYTYSASGAKLRTVHTPNLALYNSPLMGTVDYAADALTKAKTTDYVGNKVYENGTLKRILIDGGYYDAEAKNYHFYLTDHLGNNRVVTDRIGKVEQITHYYPFGMAFGEGKNSGLQPYKYNNKELDKELGLEIYDYVARQKMNDIPVFTARDPLAEKYYSWSPYVYVMNNPMKYIDPTGMDTVYVNNQGEKIVSIAGEGEDYILAQLPEVTVEDKDLSEVQNNENVAIGYELNFSFSLGRDIDATPISVVHILKGPDKGKVIQLGGGGDGWGLPGGSAGVKVTSYNYVGKNMNNFRAKSFEGGGNSSTISVGELGVASYGASSSIDNKTGGVLRGTSIGAGIGGGSPIGISKQKTESKRIKF